MDKIIASESTSGSVWLLQHSSPLFSQSLYHVGHSTTTGKSRPTQAVRFLPHREHLRLADTPTLDLCQAAISKPIIWVSFASNVATDIYLISIPLPMLWSSSLRLLKKIASTIILGAGVFVLICAILKSVFVLVVSLFADNGTWLLFLIFLLQDPVNGAQLAGAWGTRESFVAVVTTNLPMVFPLIRTWLAPFFGTMLKSSQRNSYQSPSAGFRTIGGGGGGNSYNRGRGPQSANPITANMTFNDSEERMVEEVKMQNMKTFDGSHSHHHQPSGIVVSNEVEVTHEDRRSQNSDHQPAHRVHETW